MIKTTKRLFLGVFCALFVSLLLPAGQATAASQAVTFHFYGAHNCPPCMAFKRNHLADVRAMGEKHGFAVKENLIPRLQDIPSVGVYGAADPILREAGKQIASYYPPIFFTTDTSGAVIVAYQGNWRAAMKAAIKAAASSDNA